jgi:integrase
MMGDIYTSERCSCGGRLEHDSNVDGFRCRECQRVTIPKEMRVKFGRRTSRRFNNYKYGNARQFLEGLRFKKYEGSYDHRDYEKDSPLSLCVQSKRWLLTKQGKSKKYLSNLNRWMEMAKSEWGPRRNVKDVRYGDIEDLVLRQSVSDKTKADMVACYSQFFKWIAKREGTRPPEMPEIEYKLGWRNLIDMETQKRIIDEVERICPNPRVWIGIKWLATYVAIRPQEMWLLKEKHINIDGYIVLPPDITKEGTPKLVPMLEEDIELYESLPTSLPDLPFFRRHRGKWVKNPCQHISSRAFYRWWKKACSNLGIENVDLYGGTRHSSTSALSEYFTEDEIQDSTQHKTNKAFRRYFRANAEPKRNIYTKISQLRGRDNVGQKLAGNKKTRDNQ